MIPTEVRAAHAVSSQPSIDCLAVAQRVVEAVDGTGVAGAAIARLNLPMGYAIRLPMGSDCGALYGQYQQVVDETLKQMDEVCKSTDFDDTEKSGYAAQV